MSISLTMDPVKNTLKNINYCLQTLYLQPYQDGPLTTVWFLFVLSNLIFVQIGQLLYVYVNINDWNKIASASATISTTFQGIFKVINLHIYKQQYKHLLNNVKNKFWVIDLITEKKKKEELLRIVNLVNNMIIMYLFIIFSVSTLFFTFPFITMTKNLPVRTWLPFDFTRSPVYEILYVYQVIVNLYLTAWVAGALDSFFVALMFNVTTQFYILKEVIEKIGKEHIKLLEYEKKKDMDMLIKCLKHHQLLIGFGNTLTSTFSVLLFFQYAASFILMTFGCFIMGNLSGATVYTFCLLVFAHVVQLFVYCGAGNEFYYQSISLSDAAFNSGWYQYNCPELRQALCIFIQQANRGKRITVMGMANLNFTSFVAVLRFSFSVCTFLMTVTETET